MHSLSGNSADTVTIRLFSELTALKSIWQNLETADINHPYQTYNWITYWQEHIGDKYTVTPCPVLIEAADTSPLLILPLGIQKYGSISCLVWLGGELADYHTAVYSQTALSIFTEENLYLLWNEIQKALPPFDATLLEKQPATIGDKANPFLFKGSHPHSCSAHSTAIQGPLEAFISSKRSKKSQTTERRKERRLAEAGDIKFVVADSPAEIAQLLPVMLKQKSRSYHEMGVQDLFADEGYREFVTTLTKDFATKGTVVLCALLIGDRVAATVWGVTHSNCYYYLLPTYERDELTRFSPGNLLLRYLFGWCIEKNITTFDFTAGDERYKEFWCDKTLPLYDYLKGSTLRGHLYIWKEKTFRMLKLKIKNSPILFSAAKRIRSTLSKA
jgi:CelD/BcsL family acetyltransferase involved in cellulose biosynthesis